jgi:hypothetical protein
MITLLDGANIAIRKVYNSNKKAVIRYSAFVSCGPGYKEAISYDIVRAIGMAVILQAGYTMADLLTELDQDK